MTDPVAIERVKAHLTEAVRLQGAVTAEIQHALDVLSVMNPGVASKLIVPWVGQNTTRPDDDISNNDCGPACVAMWLASLDIAKSVDDISSAAGLTRGYVGTLPMHLMRAAAFWGLSLERVLNFTAETVKDEVRNGKPCIVLVHYGSLPVRFSKTFTAGHWLIVVGYDEGKVIYHDPNWPDRAQGAYLEMTDAQFEKAMADCKIDGNLPNQGLRSKAR
jgi:hypothetical protein